MDIGGITTFALGLVAGVVLFALVLPPLNNRLKQRHQGEIDRRERVIADLREERAEDRETNRHLRHQLAINTPQNFEMMREERDAAVGELDGLIARLREARAQLDVRDRSLREARLAIHDIRVRLERDRNGAAVFSDGDSSATGNGSSPTDSPVTVPH